MPSGKDTVPESWKQENGGPYVQGPDGKRWFISPFNQEPWRTAAPPIQAPPEFVAIFGPEPKTSDFLHTQWEQDLKYFKRAGVPEWAEPAQIDAANRLYQFWDMGAMQTFEGRYGWGAKFTGAKSFEVAAHAAISFPHLIIAGFQISELQEGRVPAKKHPFVPPRLWPDYKPDPAAHQAS